MARCQPCVEKRLRKLLLAERTKNAKTRAELETIKGNPRMYRYPHELWLSLMRSGTEVAPRGMRTRELFGQQIVLNPTDWFFDYDKLPINMDYVKKELAWYLRGEKDDLSICEHASIWKDMVDDFGEIQSNYGFYFNQDRWAVEDELKRDRASRRAVININRPEHSMSAPDVPCTLTMHYMIRNDRLDAHVTMRSQDAVYGLRNDIPAFQLFKASIAHNLDVKPGYLYLHVNSFHVYERHFEVLEKVNKNPAFNVSGFKDFQAFCTWVMT